MVAVRYQAAPLDKTWGPGSTEVGIVIHETANTRAGADAQAHANLQTRSNVRQASWHWSTDQDEAIQSFPHDIRTWSAGQAGKNYVAVELCVNSDGDFSRTVQNGVELVQHIRRLGVGTSLVNHQMLTGKNCPTKILAGFEGGWTEFVRRCNSGGAPAPAPAPAPSGLKVDGFEGSNTLKAEQRAMGTTVDGKLSQPSQFTAALQAWLNAKGFRDYDGRMLEIDGYGHRSNNTGAVTERTRTDWAYQTYLAWLEPGYVPDGKWGHPSAGVKIIQRAANSGRLFK
jgi:hypothetical protein